MGAGRKRWTGEVTQRLLVPALAITIAVLLCGCGGKPAQTASGGPSTSLTEQELTQKAFALVEDLASGRYDAVSARFDETMRKALPEGRLAKVFQQVVAQMGPYKTHTGARTERAEGYLAVIVQAHFEKAPLDIRVVFDQAGLVAGLFFQPAKTAYSAPAYVRSETFATREVVVENGEWKLGGTLCVPRQGPPFPAVVLVHGSGPNDRDETLGPNRPFRDLAEGLASRGVMVLRYEKRTFAYPKVAAAADLTLEEETVSDAAAAFFFLRSQPEVDMQRVFILGHSLGGYALPRVGRLTPEAAGYIILAGPARPLEDIVLEQSRYIASLENPPSAETEQALARLEKQVALVKSPDLDLSVPSSDLPLGLPASYWLDLRGYDPPAEMASLRRPTLVLQGQRDYQVTETDFHLWEAALTSVPGCRFLLYPELDHLFFRGQSRAVPSDYLREGHVDAQVIEDIVSWIDTVR